MRELKAHTQQAQVFEEIASLVHIPKPAAVRGQATRHSKKRRRVNGHRDCQQEHSQQRGSLWHIETHEHRQPADQQHRSRHQRHDPFVPQPLGHHALNQFISEIVLKPQPNEDQTEQKPEEQVRHIVG